MLCFGEVWGGVPDALLLYDELKLLIHFMYDKLYKALSSCIISVVYKVPLEQKQGWLTVLLFNNSS